MKKNWTTPSIEVQQFEANESVAACIQGTIVCAIPGTSEDVVNDGNTARTMTGAKTWNGITVTFRNGGEPHGLCGNLANIAFDSETASGYEKTNAGNVDRNRPIFNISGYNAATGTYNVSWQSTDGTHSTGTYNHYGVLNITNVIEGRPNHS